jgi:lipopolysaccharide transport protein LptA
MLARGQEATYDGRQDRVVLTAKLTGARIEAQLRARTATAHRAAAAPVQASVRRKGETEPLVLTADRIDYDGSTDRVTATGKPLVRHPRGTLTADRLWSDLADTAENPMVVRAEGNVLLDAREEAPNQRTIQARGRSATYARAQNLVTLEGGVEGEMTTPDEPKPRRFSGERMTYDLTTKRLALDGTPAQVRVTRTRRR